MFYFIFTIFRILIVDWLKKLAGLFYFLKICLYICYIYEAYVNIFRETINDVRDDPCLFLRLVYDI
jgi:hypothetical protein